MPAVSLDTNVFLLGLRGVDSSAGTFLQELPCRPSEVIDSETCCRRFTLGE